MFKPKTVNSTSYAVIDLGEPLMLSQCIYEEPEHTPELKSIGTFRITYYCPGACCNGSNAGVDCKGNPLVPGTIATNDLPYGTEVWMNWGGEWIKYTVRDRMAKKERSMPAIDIFVDLPHDFVQDMGVDYMEVFILE